MYLYHSTQTGKNAMSKMPAPRSRIYWTSLAVTKKGRGVDESAQAIYRQARQDLNMIALCCTTAEVIITGRVYVININIKRDKL